MNTLIKEITRWAVAVVVVGACFLAHDMQQSAMAADTDLEAEDEEIASLEEGPIVRRQLLHRSGRLELEPRMTFSVNDAFIRNGLPGLALNYYLNNTFGIGGSFGFGALHMDTSLRENLEITLSNQSSDEFERTTYSQIGWAADFGLTYVPAFGKFSIFNSIFAHYDFHLFAGMAMVSEVAVLADGDSDAEPDPVLEGIRPGGMFGAGMRFFMNDRISLNFQLKNYLFPRAQISQGDAEPGLSNTVMLSAGIGFFFPGEVQISR